MIDGNGAQSIVAVAGQRDAVLRAFDARQQELARQVKRDDQGSHQEDDEPLVRGQRHGAQNAAAHDREDHLHHEDRGNDDREAFVVQHVMEQVQSDTAKLLTLAGKAKHTALCER